MSNPSPIHPACLSDEELEAACDLTFTRRSGPGGQHRNKVETAVVVIHRPTGIQASATENRSQVENRRLALTRLRLQLALDVRNSAAEQPSELWLKRRQSNRICVSTTHSEFPGLLAEALDVLYFHQYLPGPAAKQLGVSTSQLIGLLRKHPPALSVLNQARRIAGKPPLK